MSSPVKVKPGSSQRLVTFEDFVRLSKRIYRTVGLISYDDDPAVPMPLINKLLTTLTLCILFTALNGDVINFIVGCSNFDNFLQLTALIPCIFFCVNGLGKILTILYKRKEVNELVADMKDIFPESADQQKEYRVDEYKALADYIFGSFASFMLVWIWCFNLMAIVLSTVQYFLNGEFIRRLPYYMWYPFEWNRPIVFELTYVFNVSCGHCVMSPLLGSDLLIGGLLLQICMHFDALKRRLAHLKPSKDNPRKDMRELLACIRMQRKLNDISGRLERIFSFSVLVNFVSSMMIICLCGFQTTFGKNWMERVIYGLFLPSNTYQILFLSYLGNRMIESSQSVADGAYEGEWYNSDNRYMKFLLMMITRSQQRPQVLTAMKFSVVSLQSFNRLMSSSYSYFALLRTIYSE